MFGNFLSDTAPNVPGSVVAPALISAFALLLGALYPFYRSWQQIRKEQRDRADAIRDNEAEIDRLKTRLRRLERSLAKRERVNDDD